MKKTFTLVLLLQCLYILSSKLYAQKLDVDKYKFETQLIQLPVFELDDSLKSYSITLIDNGILRDLGISKSEIVSYISIDGFKKFDRGGHVLIEVEVNMPEITNTKIADKTIIKKDTSGKEISRTPQFIASVEMFVPIRYSLKMHDGEILHDGVISDRNAKKWFEASGSDQIKKTEKEASSYLAKFQREKMQEFVKEKLSGISSFLNDTYGYRSRTVFGYLQITDSKKHPENTPFIENTQHLKTFLGSFRHDSMPPVSNITSQLDYFRNVVDSNKSDAKDAKKLRLAALTNLAITYYYLEDFQKCINTATEIITDDYNKKEAQSLINLANKTKIKIERSNYGSRHFVRDISKVENPTLILEEKERVAKEEAKKKAEELVTKEVIAKIEEFDKLIASNPKDPLNYYLKGQFFEKNGQREMAIATYSSGITQIEGDANILKARGNLFYSLKNFEMAEKDMQMVVNIDSTNLSSLHKLIQVKEINKSPKNISDYQRAYKLSQASEDGVKLMSVLYENYSKEQAIELGENLKQKFPNDYSVLMKLTGVYIESNECDKAKENSQLLFKIENISDVMEQQMLITSGRVNHCQKQYADAIKDYKKALKVKSNTLKEVMGKNVSKMLQNLITDRIERLIEISENELENATK